MPIHQIKLINRYEVAPHTIVLIFEKPPGLTFKPGQYGGFTLINPEEKDAGGITRRFSLLSTPHDDYLAIATRIQNSAYKRELQKLPLGQPIKFAGPTGAFILHEEKMRPAVLIAGGIGITPFYCMIRHAYQEQNGQPLFLFYGNRTLKDAPFLEDLEILEGNLPHFKLIPVIENPEENFKGERGYITDQIIKKYITDIHQPIYYICGSPAMVTALQETLAEMDIDEENIKVEDFPGY